MKYFLILVFTAFLIGACSSYVVDMKEKTAYPEGRLIYVSKCGACHDYFQRDKLTAQGWDSILVPMKKKAHLTDEQRDKVYNYLSEKITPDSVQPSY